MSVQNHRTVCACVGPGLAERPWCKSTGSYTADVAVVDVEPWHTQELVVESVENIGTELNAEALIEFKALSDCQIQLVTCHRTEVIAALRTGEWIPAADRVNRKRVVYDEVDIRGTDKGTGSRSCRQG